MPNVDIIVVVSALDINSLPFKAGSYKDWR